MVGCQVAASLQSFRLLPTEYMLIVINKPTALWQHILSIAKPKEAPLAHNLKDADISLITKVIQHNNSMNINGFQVIAFSDATIDRESEKLYVLLRDIVSGQEFKMVLSDDQ